MRRQSLELACLFRFAAMAGRAVAARRPAQAAWCCGSISHSQQAHTLVAPCWESGQGRRVHDGGHTRSAPAWRTASGLRKRPSSASLLQLAALDIVLILLMHRSWVPATHPVRHEAEAVRPPCSRRAASHRSPPKPADMMSVHGGVGTGGSSA